MKDKKKRRLRKSLTRRKKIIAKKRLETAWRNLFVRSGFLKK